MELSRSRTKTLWLYITINGTLSPGVSGAGTIHLASFNPGSGALTLSSTSTWAFDITSTTTKDLVALTSTKLTLGKRYSRVEPAKHLTNWNRLHRDLCDFYRRQFSDWKFRQRDRLRHHRLRRAICFERNRVRFDVQTGSRAGDMVRSGAGARRNRLFAAAALYATAKKSVEAAA